MNNYHCSSVSAFGFPMTRCSSLVEIVQWCCIGSFFRFFLFFESWCGLRVKDFDSSGCVSCYTYKIVGLEVILLVMLRFFMNLLFEW